MRIIEGLGHFGYEEADILGFDIKPPSLSFFLLLIMTVRMDPLINKIDLMYHLRDNINQFYQYRSNKLNNRNRLNGLLMFHLNMILLLIRTVEKPTKGKWAVDREFICKVDIY